MAEVVASYGGDYFTHHGSEGYEQEKEIDFIIRVAEETGMAAHTFHFKIRGRENWGTVGRYIDQIEEVRARGLDITANQYPYPAMYHGWGAFFPLWAREGEPGAFARAPPGPGGTAANPQRLDLPGLVRRARLVGGDRPGQLLQSRAHPLREHDDGRDRQGEGRRRSGHERAVLDALDAERREHRRQREGRAQRA